MSKLFDEIQAICTNQKIVKKMPMVDIRTICEDDFNYGYRYRVVATLGAQTVITNHGLSKMTDSEFERLLREKVYRPLAEHIFGEFRLPLIEASFAAANGDSEKACELIDGVLKSMFRVGD